MRNFLSLSLFLAVTGSFAWATYDDEPENCDFSFSTVAGSSATTNRAIGSQIWNPSERRVPSLSENNAAYHPERNTIREKEARNADIAVPVATKQESATFTWANKQATAPAQAAPQTNLVRNVQVEELPELETPPMPSTPILSSSITDNEPVFAQASTRQSSVALPAHRPAAFQEAQKPIAQMVSAPRPVVEPVKLPASHIQVAEPVAPHPAERIRSQFAASLEQQNAVSTPPAYLSSAVYGSGMLRFIFGSSRPAVFSVLHEYTDIELQAGEKVKEIKIGNPEAWETSSVVAADVPHIIIRPLAAVTTTMLCVTDKRVYYFDLACDAKRHTDRVGFVYSGEDINGKEKTLAATSRQSVTSSKAGLTSPTSIIMDENGDIVLSPYTATFLAMLILGLVVFVEWRVNSKPVKKAVE